ncbi:MAG: hypothetical protein ABW185_28980 [Sedimenticola sp.]
MSCHVAACPRKDVIPTLRAFQKHWDKFHVDYVMMRKCNLCCKLGRDNHAIRRHIADRHKGRSVSSVSQKVRNDKYIDPRDRLPPRRLDTGREMARQAAMCTRNQQKEEAGSGISWNQQNVLARDEEADVRVQPDGTTVVSVHYRRSSKKQK